LLHNIAQMFNKSRRAAQLPSSSLSNLELFGQLFSQAAGRAQHTPLELPDGRQATAGLLRKLSLSQVERLATLA
jgi:hypothetical protein